MKEQLFTVLSTSNDYNPHHWHRRRKKIVSHRFIDLISSLHQTVTVSRCWRVDNQLCPRLSRMLSWNLKLTELWRITMLPMGHRPRKNFALLPTKICWWFASHFFFNLQHLGRSVTYRVHWMSKETSEWILSRLSTPSWSPRRSFSRIHWSPYLAWNGPLSSLKFREYQSEGQRC